MEGVRARPTSRGPATSCAPAARPAVGRAVHVSTEAVLMHGQPLVNADETIRWRSLPAPYASTKAIAEQVVLEGRGRAGGMVVRPRFVWPRRHDAAAAARRGHPLGRVPLDRRRPPSHLHHPRRQHDRGLIMAAERGHHGRAYFVTDGDPVLFRDFISTLMATRAPPPTGSVPAPVARAVMGTGESPAS